MNLKIHNPADNEQQTLSDEYIGRVISRDALKWAEAAEVACVLLEEIEPQYQGKEPQTPWYKTSIETQNSEPAGELIFGTRFSMDSIEVKSEKILEAKQWRSILKTEGVDKFFTIQTLDSHWVGSVDELNNSGQCLVVHLKSGSPYLGTVLRVFADALRDA